MPIQSKDLKNIATVIKNDVEPLEIVDEVNESSAGLANNKAVIRFLNNKIATKNNIEITKARCNAFMKGIENKSCAKCVGKCSEYRYRQELKKRLIKTNP